MEFLDFEGEEQLEAPVFSASFEELAEELVSNFPTGYPEHPGRDPCHGNSTHSSQDLQFDSQDNLFSIKVNVLLHKPGCWQCFEMEQDLSLCAVRGSKDEFLGFLKTQTRQN